jgi:hypothetical protein
VPVLVSILHSIDNILALRYTLHPPKMGEGIDVHGLRLKAPPVRIFVLGARAESSLPREVWLQLTHMFPQAIVNLIFVGPESMANRDDEFPLPDRTPENPFGGIVEDRLGPQMKITTYVDYFHTMHNAQYFYPYDPYFDCFMLFHPGLGHPASSHEWEATLPQLLETKVPVLCTGYTQWDMERDIGWVKDKCAGEFDILLEPGENRFRSLRWDLNDLDPHDISCGNWGLWAFRGKRYLLSATQIAIESSMKLTGCAGTRLPIRIHDPCPTLQPRSLLPRFCPERAYIAYDYFLINHVILPMYGAMDKLNLMVPPASRQSKIT